MSKDTTLTYEQLEVAIATHPAIERIHTGEIDTIVGKAYDIRLKMGSGVHHYIAYGNSPDSPVCYDGEHTEPWKVRKNCIITARRLRKTIINQYKKAIERHGN